jgi:flagellar motor switch protein FliG
MTDRVLSNIEKAAVLMITIGESDAAEILRSLGPKDVQRIGVAMSKLDNVPKSVVEDVVDDFIDSAEDQTGIGIDNDNYIINMITQALGEDKAKTFIERFLTTANTAGLDMLRWMQARELVDVLRFEHPQIQAVIISNLEPEQAAQVLSEFEESVRLDLVMRISILDRIRPEAMNDLNEMLEIKLGASNSSQETSIGGANQVASILNYIGTSLEQEILDGLRLVNEPLAEEIKELMFVFENFINTDDRSLQRILKDVPPDAMMLALKGASEGLKEKMLGNISERAADIMRDDMEAKGPVRVSDVDVAQKTVLNIARKLAEGGEITIGASEDMI